MKDRHYVYVDKEQSLSFGERLSHVGERDNDNCRTVDPKIPYRLGDSHWEFLWGTEIVVFGKDNGKRFSARIRPCTVFEVTPNGIVIVAENVQPGDAQFEQIAETASA